MSQKKTETNSITNDYFNITRDYKTKFGERTILLMQVGAFFEVYGVKHATTGMITRSEIVEFAQICQLNISEKKGGGENDQIVMAGFRDYTLEKYIQKLSDNGYTTVVYVQEKDGIHVKRFLQSIYSPGTYLSYETDSSPETTNNIMSIWIETFKPLNTKTTTSTKSRDTIVCGVAVANIFTGKSSMFEYQSPFYMNPTTFDELERCISIFSPSEVIINSSLDPSDIQSIIQYTNIKSSMIHRNYLQSGNKDSANEVLENCRKQKYIQYVLARFYGEDTLEICAEFNTHTIATQAFCYLLHFIQEHNPDLVRNIELPIFNNASSRMTLANHTLKQLNIIDDSSMDGKQKGQLSSVLAFLNKCCSPMGRREFQQQITNPNFDEAWLNSEYDIISVLLEPENQHFISLFRKQLGSIRDIEKVCRQLVIHKVYPNTIYHLYNSISTVQQTNLCLLESPRISDYLCACLKNITDPSNYIENITKKILHFMDSRLMIELCRDIQSVQSFDQNIIQRGISPELDKLIDTYEYSLTAFHNIRDYLNQLMKTTDTDETEYVKIHETEKSGCSLQITKKRGTTLKTLLSKMKTPMMIGKESICPTDIKFTTAAGSADDIDFPLLSRLCKDIYSTKERINQQTVQVYLDFLKEFEQNCFQELENIAKYIAKMDVLQCKAYIAKEYNYCRPEIKESSKSFVHASELRHCLIEHIQHNEVYVTNDICIGSASTEVAAPDPAKLAIPDGILLYGTNAVGKTSLIRALGIAVIMAQCGMYVPCSQFIYKPYTSIYSRILGNDNIFKGLSTFAVEMSELRMILRMADENSLILGDELCSGTETESALSIFMAGLMDLHKKQSSFIFATHFHEIIHYDEMKELTNLVCKHMSVHYDRELDCLVYDRKIKEGPGNRMYGLEVCKSLYLPEDFLERAYQIRNKYYPENMGGLSHKSTTYNADKIRGRCEICNTNIGEEIHHLQQQKTADENGFIGSFHKNHPANLASVCQTCHDKIHASEVKITRKKTTKGYILAESNSIIPHGVV